MKSLRKSTERRRGAAMVEYALLVAGVALIAAAGVAVFGHKTNDMISAVAAVLPGAHAGDNGPIVSGKIIETTEYAAAGDEIALDIDTIVTNSGTQRLGNNFGTPGDLATLVTEP